MAFCLIASILLPVATSTVCVLLVYALFIAKKILALSGEKNKALPNVERLKQSLPLTLSPSWKLGEPVNGVPTWQNQMFSSETENGVVACQGLLQAPAEAVIKELSQSRILQIIHPWICDISIAPDSNINIKQTEEAEIASDVVAVEIKVPNSIDATHLYLNWKNSLCLKRRWKCSKDSPSWLVIAPEYKLHEACFGVWQCFMAIDIPAEVKGSSSSMCLLSIFAAPISNERMPFLKQTIASQVICAREHIDSLYLKKMFRKEMNTPKRRSTARTPEDKTNGSAVKNSTLKTATIDNVKSPKKSFAGKEERGFVEAPAEINTIPKTAISKEEQSPDDGIQYINERVEVYKEIINEAFDSLLKVYEADEKTPGWNYLGNRNGVEIYRMPGDASCPSDCFKGTAQAKVPISYALQYCTDLEFKKEWDDVFNEGRVVENLDEVTKVAHMEYKPVWPTTARDFCSITATRHIKDSMYAMAAKAVTHSSCPPNKGKQRAEILVGGFVIEGISEDPPLCNITYITRADLKGRIPASMVNKVNEKQPMYAGVIRDKIEERYMYQDPPDEGDVKIIATRKYPSIIEKSSSVYKSDIDISDVKPKSDSPVQMNPNDKFFGTDETKDETGDSVENKTAAVSEYRELSKEEIDALSPENEVPWDTMSESSVTSYDQNEFQEPEGEVKSLAELNLELPRDHVGNVDYRVLGNQTAAKLLEEVLLASKIDSNTKPPDYADQIEEWTYQGTMKNVVVLRKIHSDSNFYSFLGRGIMNVLPVTVWEAVKNPSTRFVYDNMLKKTKVIKEVDNGVKIIHMRHETTACFVKQAREFLILTKERADSDKYVLAGVSVNLPECPIEKNCIRGKVLASGWVIEPVLIKGRPCSLVTYISQVDFGGKLPIRLINLIAKRQPMSIAYLRTYLESAEKRF